MFIEKRFRRLLLTGLLLNLSAASSLFAQQADGAGPLSEMKQLSMRDVFSVGKIIWVVVFLILGYLVIKFVAKIFEVWAEKSSKRRVMLKGIAPIIRLVGWGALTFIIIKGVLRPPRETIIAFFASIGVAIGFAAQDVLKNIFGGITILLDRPFKVGDKIEIGNSYGEVLQLGLRSTRIRTADDSIVTVPNSDLVSKSVSNSNAGEANCQVVAEIFLPLTVDTELVRNIAVEAAQISQYVFLNKPIAVLFFHHALEDRVYYRMRLKAYVLDIRYEFAFKSDMTEIVTRELLARGIVKPGDYYARADQ